MNRLAMVIIVGTLAVRTASAQSDKDLQTASQASAPVENAQAAPLLASGAAINAALTKSMDSKKAKTGDAVIAQTTAPIKEEGRTMIPKGIKLEGHVTQASSRAKGDSFSTLGIVFDKAILKAGQEVPLNVTVQAIASAPDSGRSHMEMEPVAGNGATAAGPGRTGGGAPGGMVSTPPVNTNHNATNEAANTDTNNATAGTGAVGGWNADGRLAPNSRGVFGLQGIGLAVPAAGAQPGVVITSTDKNVHLDSGTQLLLVTQVTPQAGTPKP